MTHAEIDAKHYRESSSVQRNHAEKTLALHKFRGNERILDIGCGDGSVTRKLAELVPDGFVLGVDPSTTMIDLAQESYGPDKYKNLSFGIGAAEDISFDAEYNLVTAFACLHWVRGQEIALTRIADALKRGGRFLAYAGPKESPYLRLLEEMVYREKWVQYAPQAACKYWITSEAYRDIAKKLDLEVLHMRTACEIAHYQNATDFKNRIRGWLPCLIPLPEELQEEFLNDFAKHARDSYGSREKEAFDVPYDMITMYWEKR